MSRLLLIFNLLLSGILFWGCKSSAQADAASPKSGNMEYSLEITPRPISLADVAQVKMVLHLKNTSSGPLDTEPHLFTLEVNGQPSMAFSMRMSNGIRSNEWFALPAGERLSQDLSALAPTIFTAAGHYRLVLGWKETKAAALDVVVE